jgi:hypothetical protein
MSENTATISITEETIQRGAEAIAGLDYASRIKGDCIKGDNSLAVRNLLNGNYDRAVKFQAALVRAVNEDGSLPSAPTYAERRALHERIVGEMVAYYLGHPELQK